MFIALKGHSFYNLFILVRKQGLAKNSSSLNKLRNDGRRGISIACCNSLCNTSYVKLNSDFFPCWRATGSSFPDGVQQGLLSLLVCNRVFFPRVFFPCWYATGFSFPAGAQQGLLSQGLLSLLVRNRVFFPCWCATGSSFPTVAQQGLLSLLVRNRVFFPCWCATGSPFPAGVQQGLLFLLVCKRIFFPCWCFTWCPFPAGDSQSSFPAGASHMSYLKILPWQPNKSSGFRGHLKQNGGCGGQLGFIIGTVLAIFDLEVILLLQCVSNQIVKRFGWRRQKLVFKMGPMTAILDFQLA